MFGLKKYLRPYYAYIALTMFIKCVGTGLELLIPYFMEIILDDVVPTGNVRSIITYGVIMLLCAIGCLVMNITANRMSAVSSGKITEKLRHDLFDRLQQLSAGQMDALTVSSAESRLTSDTYNVNQFLARMQRLGIRAPILLIGGIVMMLGMDPVLSLILVAMLPPIGFIVYFVTKKSVPLYTEEQSVLDDTVRVLQENITGIRVIKALSKTEYEKSRFDRVNTRLTDVDRKAGLITAVTNPATSLILNLGLTLVVLFGAYRVNGGFGKSGVIITFLQYFVMIMNAMLGITRIFVMWSKGEASAKRVTSVISIEPDMLVDASLFDPTSDLSGAPHIEFRDVCFSYNTHHGDDVGENLSHISFSLRHGESLGIIGATGVGKSTVISLLMRLYDPQSGSVLIDGRDVRSIPEDELRAKFGTVFQSDFVMEGTVAENIDFFRDVPRERMESAASDAQATDFIMRREGTYDSGVAVRGNNLSGGQKQRLLIARALAGDPEILILDDASSALDYRTDADLRRALRKNYSGATTITVAQRVSSVKNCTKIIVLADGKPIGYGTHEELLHSCDEYRMITESQMGEDIPCGKEDV